MNENKRQRHGKRAGRLAAAGLAAALLWTGAALARWPRVSAASSQEIQQTLDGLRQQAQEIAEQGAALEQEIGQNQSETKSTIERKSEIDRQIHQTEAEIQNTDAQIQQYSLLIAQKQSQVEDAQAEMSAMQETYKARIRAMEEAGTVSYWAVLFQANSFADLLSRIDTIHEVAEADQRMLEKLKDQAAVLEAARGELETALTEQQALRDGLTEQQAQLAAQRQEADGLLLELAAEGEALSEEFLANAQQEAALRQEILDAQAAYEAALSAEEAARLAQQNQNNVAGGSGAAVTPGTSGFVAPVDGPHVITSSFSVREHPLFGYTKMHPAIDLAKNQGSPIYAIAAGTVTTAVYGEANGYYVSLAHGSGYTSIYCHMTKYIVSVGDSVTQGQVIGYVGSTGWSTGPHLHFELHQNGTALNPAEYLPLS